MTWLNDTLQGIFVGGGYALTAVGLSLMFGVMRLVNLAHGDLAVCATYLVTTVMAALGVPFLAALLLMLPVAFAAGAVLQLALFDRALRTGPLAPLALAPYLVGTNITQPMVTLFLLAGMASLWNLLAGYAGMISFGQQAYLGIGAYALYLFGRAGISPFAVIPLAAAGFGAIGAMLIISGLYIDPASAFNINYSADMLFMVVIGGLGTIEGPLIGALILFAAQQVFAQYGAWYLVGIGALAIAVVLLAPAGLWGFVSGRRGWSLLPVGYQVRSPRRTP